MRKKIIIISVLVCVFALIVSVGALAEKYIDEDIFSLFELAKKASDKDNRTVVAMVDGKEIYQETIDFLAKGEEISLKNSPETTDKTITDVDTDAILQRLIRNAVVLSEAKRQGLTVSLKEAKKFTMENYEMVKEIGGDAYEMILNYMDAMDMTEEEYFEICSEVNQNQMTRAKLYEKFAEGKAGTYDEIVAEYEKYIDKLIEDADIEYVN